MMKFDTPEFFKLHKYGAYIIQLYCMQKCIKIKSRKFSSKTENNCRNNSPLKPYKITLRKTHINFYIYRNYVIFISPKLNTLIQKDQKGVAQFKQKAQKLR